MNRFFCLLTYFLKENFLKDENKRFYKGRFREASESSWVEKEKRNFNKGKQALLVRAQP